MAERTRGGEYDAEKTARQLTEDGRDDARMGFNGWREV
jgi:hypothetical protein